MEKITARLMDTRNLDGLMNKVRRSSFLFLFLKFGFLSHISVFVFSIWLLSVFKFEMSLFVVIGM